MLSPLQKRLLDGYQRNFPLSPTPYLDIANDLGVSEAEVLAAVAELNAADVISRVGPIIPPNRVGVSTLAAMAIPEQRLPEIAQLISAYPEVNHNYEREHTYNLWFVLIAADAAHLQQTIAAMEQETGFKIMSLPLVEDYFIDLSFKLDFHDSRSS